MPLMRAKMQVQSVTKQGEQEKVDMVCVAKSGSYPADGADEDNSFARWTPAGSCTITIANPALYGKLTQGQKFYLDFTEAPQ